MATGQTEVLCSESEVSTDIVAGEALALKFGGWPQDKEITTRMN